MSQEGINGDKVALTQPTSPLNELGSDPRASLCTSYVALDVSLNSSTRSYEQDMLRGATTAAGLHCTVHDSTLGPSFDRVRDVVVQVGGLWG